MLGGKEHLTVLIINKSITNTTAITMKKQDGLGDACDSDIDNDSVKNEKDNCKLISNKVTISMMRRMLLGMIINMMFMMLTMMMLTMICTMIMLNRTRKTLMMTESGIFATTVHQWQMSNKRSILIIGITCLPKSCATKFF